LDPDPPLGLKFWTPTFRPTQEKKPEVTSIIFQKERDVQDTFEKKIDDVQESEKSGDEIL